MEILEDYLPEPISEEELRQWIINNLDFLNYKNKMQAMGDIMKFFGAKIDGKMAKKILKDL